mgnify:CR=1 FL=1
MVWMVLISTFKRLAVSFDDLLFLTNADFALLVAVGFQYAGITPAQMVTWLAQASQAVKAASSSLLVSQTAQASAFGPIGNAGAVRWSGATGGFVGVYNAAPSAIDW